MILGPYHPITKHVYFGMDRWALCNAHFLEGYQSFLLVTMGTCITYNVVCDGVFLGGAISPGWEMRYEAMNKMTAALPRVQFSETSGLLVQILKEVCMPV